MAEATGMKAMRLALAKALEDGLDKKFRIVPFPKSLDNVEANRTVVMLDRTNVQRLATNPIGDYRNDLTLTVITSKTDGEASENLLDDALDAVIVVLDGIDWLLWRTATRAVFGDQQAPCYQITIEAVSSKE